MAEIKENFGEAGANVAPAGSGGGEPSLAQALRDIADDLANGKAATIASADAIDLPTTLTLVNEIKAALNAVQGTALKTTKG